MINLTGPNCVSFVFANAVFKVNNDPNLDDEDIVIPTANMSGSGSQRVLHPAGNYSQPADDDFDDF